MITDLTQTRAAVASRQISELAQSNDDFGNALGLTGMCHLHNAQIDEASRWLASLSPRENPEQIVRHLAQRFGISPEEACVAIGDARWLRLKKT